MIFENKGWENTPKVAELVCKYAKEQGIKHVVIASKTGYTTDIFLKEFEKQGVEGVHFVNVTHCYGDLGPGQCEMTSEKRKELTDRGVSVITATHALSGAERGIVNMFGGTSPAILIAQALKMLGQGMKVGVEISLMAMDNGALPYGEEVIAVGGCGHGADYAISLIPGHSNDLFKTKVIDIICKPRIS
ncbi:MAG: pyruvate kinase alpha/beta domain-containing protein [Oscillospiraceae bacterium]